MRRHDLLFSMAAIGYGDSMRRAGVANRRAKNFGGLLPAGAVVSNAYASPPEAAKIVADGDSLTDPGLGITTWPTLLAARYPVTNIAVGGSVIPGAAPSITARQGTFDNARAARTPGVIWIGTNDVAGGTPGATALTQWATYIAARRAAGWTAANGNPLVLVNMMQRNSPGFPQAERTAFNAGFNALDGDYFLDVSAGPPGSPGDGINWSGSDFVHLTNAGQQWLYDNKFYPLIRSLTFAADPSGDPLAILGANLKWWVRGDLLVTQAAGVATAWGDSSGNGVNFAGVGSIAYNATGLDGRPTLKGDNTLANMTATFSRAAPGTQPFFVYFVARIGTWTLNKHMWNDGGAALIASPSATSLRPFNGTLGTNVNLGSASTWFRIWMKFLADGTCRWRVGAAEQSAGATGTSASGASTTLFSGGAAAWSAHEIAQAFCSFGVPTDLQLRGLDANTASLFPSATL